MINLKKVMILFLKYTMRLISFVPAAVRRGAFALLLYLYYLLSARYRLITMHNLRRSFPQKSEGQLRKIALGAYKNIAIVAAEYFVLPFLTKEKVKQIVEIEGYDNYLAAKKKGRGVIVFAAHFGNWELQVASFPLLVEPLAIIYRPMDNPILEDITRLARTAGGNILVNKRGAIKESIRILAEGGSIGIMVDQNMSWQAGVFVDFFNRPACTARAIAGLALATGAQTIASFMVRQPSGGYKLIFSPVVEIVQTGDLERDTIKNTQEFTAIVENMVREYPEQWLWLHHRWKTKCWQVGK